MTELQAYDLRCEYLTNPLGLEEKEPRLYWKIKGDGNNIAQMKYRILSSKVQKDLESHSDNCLDSGWIQSSENTHIAYPGGTLNPEERIYWQVRIEDKDGNLSEWSEPAYFESGIKEWNAHWISSPLVPKEKALRPSPLLRKSFVLPDKTISKARIYSSARGLYSASLNGEKVTDALFTPGCTNYKDRILYQTYDIGEQLKPGENVIASTLATGWYAGNYGYEGQWNIYGDTLCLLCEIHVDFEDGTRMAVCSDGSWKTSLGPIEHSDMYMGEQYNSAKEIPGWDNIDFDDASWIDAVVEDLPLDLLQGHQGEYIQRTKEIKPVEIIKSPAGETIINMGQNMVGWLKVRVKGKTGDRLSYDFAEVLDKDGNFYTENLRGIADMKDLYILKGEGEEIFEPTFTFHGFQYVRILEHPGEIELDDITGIVVHSHMEQTGAFKCSDPMISQLQSNIEWGQRGNFLDIPTDCPQRDERLGWTGDAQAFIRTGSYNFNTAPFFTKWLRDLASEQLENGNLPVVVPNVLGGMNHPPYGSAAWGDASIICPWTIYDCFGDKRILEEHYPMMVAWNDYVTGKTENHIWKNDFHFGDWLALDQPADSPSCFGGTDKEQVATAFYAYVTSLMVKISEVLGKNEDKVKYEKQLSNIRSAYFNEFVTRSGRINSNTQTAYVHALMFDLLPEEERDEAARRLVADIETRGDHISTGFTAAAYILHVLSRFGYVDVAYRLLQQKEYPSWLYSVSKGATTIWERWDGIKPDGSFQTASMNSFNHYAYGAVGDWMYPHVLGFCGSDGYRNITFSVPEDCPFEWAEGSYLSLNGLIESKWKKDEKNLNWNIAIPVNSSGRLLLSREQWESAKDAKSDFSQCFIEEKDDVIEICMGSGRYSLSIPLEELAKS